VAAAEEADVIADLHPRLPDPDPVHRLVDEPVTTGATAAPLHHHPAKEERDRPTGFPFFFFLFTEERVRLDYDRFRQDEVTWN